MKRRRVRRYRGLKQNSGVKFLGFIGIMIGAVICGYLTARFIVAPLLGYDTEVLKLDFPSEMTSLLENVSEKNRQDDEAETIELENQESKENDNEAESSDTYALQFGVFSAKSGASELVGTLKKAGVTAKVKSIDGQYKVLSEAYASKEEALQALESLKDKKNIDVFITVLDD